MGIVFGLILNQINFFALFGGKTKRWPGSAIFSGGEEKCSAGRFLEDNCRQHADSQTEAKSQRDQKHAAYPETPRRDALAEDKQPIDQFMGRLVVLHPGEQRGPELVFNPLV